MIDMQQMNVLIVDDMENMCKAIRGMLRVLNIGGQVYYAYNGLEAWQILQKPDTQVDLAIIDWNMPQNDRGGAARPYQGRRKTAGYAGDHGNRGGQQRDCCPGG